MSSNTTLSYHVAGHQSVEDNAENSFTAKIPAHQRWMMTGTPQLTPSDLHQLLVAMRCPKYGTGLHGESGSLEATTEDVHPLAQRIHHPVTRGT